MSVTDVFDYRSFDFELDESQADLAAAVRSLLGQHCTPDHVRAAESSGIDVVLLGRLHDLGLTGMTTTDTADDDTAATLVDVAVVAEELGRALAPVPFVEMQASLSALRALPHQHPAVADLVAGLGGRTRLPTLALQPVRTGGSILLPAGSVATDVVALVDETLELTRVSGLPRLPNIAHGPLARWTPHPGRDRLVLAEGDEARSAFRAGLSAWQVLTASALVGLTHTALTEGVAFARTRMTRGVPIGSLQAISHPLASVHVDVATGRNMARKAAWFEVHEPGRRPELPPLAWHHMSRAASRGAAVSVHVHGGLGVSLESTASLCFARAKAWSLPGESPGSVLAEVGRLAQHRRRTEIERTR